MNATGQIRDHHPIVDERGTNHSDDLIEDFIESINTNTLKISMVTDSNN